MNIRSIPKKIYKHKNKICYALFFLLLFSLILSHSNVYALSSYNFYTTKTVRKIKSRLRQFSFPKFLYLKRFFILLLQVLLAYFLLYSSSALKLFEFRVFLLITIVFLSLIQFFSSTLALQLSNIETITYMRKISNACYHINSYLLQMAIFNVLAGDTLLMGAPVLIGSASQNSNPYITFSKNGVTVEDLGHAYRITINKIVLAEINKQNQFELRAIIILLRHAHTHENLPLLELKDIQQAFEMSSFKKVSKWDKKVKEAGTILALDFEKNSDKIINPLKYKTNVLTDDLLDRVEQLCKENPFLTYPEIKKIVLSEGLVKKINSDTSIKRALKRIPFYSIRDSIFRQLQKGQLNFQQSYLIDLIGQLLSTIEKGQKINKAQIIKVQKIINTTNKPQKATSKKRTKIDHISQGLFSSTPDNVEIEINFNHIERITLALRLYMTQRSSFRRVSKLMGISTSTCYEYISTFSQIAQNLFAFIGVVRFSGTVCIDDKWIKVAEIKRKTNGKEKFAYAFFAIDPITSDLLDVEVFDKNDSAAITSFLLSLRAKGIKPKRIITDLARGYSNAIKEVFGEKVLHHHCLFHFKQNLNTHLDKVFGQEKYIGKRRKHLKKQLKKLICDVVNPLSRKTSRKRYNNLENMKNAYLSVWPTSKKVFDYLDRHFEKILNARENKLVMLTNNPAELVIKNFNQHYKTFAGFETLESAGKFLRTFQLVYRFSQLDKGIDDLDKKGKAPLSIAGYDVEQMPFYRLLNEPLLANFIPSLN